MQIVGVELSEGISKKSGKAYSMGKFHTLAPLAPPFGENNIAKGSMGTAYECDAMLLRKVAHIPLPFVCEVTTQDQMRFGERVTIVTDLAPVGVVVVKAA